eukprot:295222_1
MSRFKLAFSILLLLQTAIGNSLKTFYISQNGNDIHLCGNETHPCSSVGWVLSEINQININDHYEILVSGANSTYCFYNYIQYPTSIIFSSNVTTMNDWLPNKELCFSQLNQTTGSNYLFMTNSNQSINVSFHNLHFENNDNELLLFSGPLSNLKFANSEIKHIVLKGSDPLLQFNNGYFVKVVFHNISQTMRSKYTSLISVSNNLTIENSTFTDFISIDMTTIRDGKIYTFHDVIFSNIILNNSTFISSSAIININFCIFDNIELGKIAGAHFIYTPEIEVYNSHINNIYGGYNTQTMFITFSDNNGFNLFQNVTFTSINLKTIIFIGYIHLNSASGTIVYDNCVFSDLYGHPAALSAHGYILLNNCQVTNIKMKNAMVDIDVLSDRFNYEVNLFYAEQWFTATNTLFDNITGYEDTFYLVSFRRNASFINSAVTNFNEGILFFGDFYFSNYVLEIRNSQFENITSDPTGDANLIFALNKFFIMDNCLIKNIITYNSMFFIMADDYSTVPNQFNMTNTKIVDIIPKNDKKANELLFFAFQGFGQSSFFNGFSYNLYAYIYNVTFITACSPMIFVTCIDQTPVIIEMDNCIYDGSIGVLHTSGHVESHISNIEIRSTQYFPWTNAPRISQIYNSIRVIPIFYIGKQSIASMSNISLDLITICAVGEYDLFGWQLTQLGIWCDVNTLFLSNKGITKVLNMNVKTNYDKEYWSNISEYDIASNLYETIGALHAARMPGAFPENDDKMNIFFNNAGAQLDVTNLYFSNTVFRIATNEGILRMKNVSGPYQMNQELKPLDIKFHKFFSNYGDLTISDSTLIGSHVGCEFFSDSITLIDNVYIAHSLWGLWMSDNKALNITLNEVKISEIGPYWGDILFMWEVTSNWCNGEILTISQLSSRYAQIQNCYFNYSSPFGFFNWTNTDNLIIDNTEFHIDGYNNWEHNKAKYSYNSNYDLFPFSASKERTPHWFLDSIIIEITDTTSSDFSFIKINNDTVASITNSIFTIDKKLQSTYYQVPYIHFTTSKNINPSCLENNMFINNALRLSYFSKVTSCYHYNNSFPETSTNSTCWIDVGSKNNTYNTNKNQYINTAHVNVFSAIVIEDNAYLHIDNDEFIIRNNNSNYNISLLNTEHSSSTSNKSLGQRFNSNESIYDGTFTCSQHTQYIRNQITQINPSYYYILNMTTNYTLVAFEGSVDCETNLYFRMQLFDSDGYELNDCQYCGFCWALTQFTRKHVKKGIYYLRTSGMVEGRHFGNYFASFQCIGQGIDYIHNDKWDIISMKGGLLSISNIILDYNTTNIRTLPQCNPNCMQLVNGSKSLIRQAHLNCTDIDITSIHYEQYIANTVDIFNVSHNDINNINGFFPSIFEIIILDPDIFPNERLNISYNVYDIYSNLIDVSLLPDIHFTLSNNELEFSKRVEIKNGICTHCDKGIEIELYLSDDIIDKTYTIDVSIDENILSPIPSSFNINITQCEPGYGNTLSRCIPCKDGTFIFQMINNNESCYECDSSLKGVKCYGENKVIVDVDHWISIKNDLFDELIVVSQCPNGYCCKQLNGCDYSSNELCASG